jgi:hypothetical protein
MSEQEEEETVRLPGGFVVRRRFYGGVTALPDGSSPVQIDMDLTVDDSGRSKARMVLITPRRPDRDVAPEPLDEDALARINLVEAKDHIMLIEAQTHTPGRGYSWADVKSAAESGGIADALGVLDRDYPEALSAVRTARRRRQVTPQLLAEVLDLYDRGGGIQAVMKEKNYSESYAFKLLRKARQEVTP